MLRPLTDLRKLRHVITVAKAGSFSGAANTAGLTQSALTKSVADVEHVLGVKLFHRLPRGIALTDAGQAFVPRAERLLADSEDLVKNVEGLQTLATGRLRLGVAPAAFVSFLEHTVSAFARVYPGIHIEVYDGTIDEMTRMLISGEIDLVIGAANYLSAWTEVQVTTFAHLHHFFIGRLDHPLAGANPDAQTLLAYPVIMPAAGMTTEAQLRAAYIDAGLSPVPPQYTCDHFPLVKRLVAATDAISPVVSLAPPKSVFQNEFHIFSDVIYLDEHELGVAQPATRGLSAAAAAFVDIFGAFLTDSAESG